MKRTQCLEDISDGIKFCSERSSQANNIPPPADKNAKKSAKTFTVVLIMIIVLSLTGNGYLIFENKKKQDSIEQMQEELNEYRIQITKFVDAIERYENQNAGAKTYDAIKSWWDALKGLCKDYLDFGTELQDEYGEYFDEEGNWK